MYIHMCMCSSCIGRTYDGTWVFAFDKGLGRVLFEDVMDLTRPVNDNTFYHVDETLVK